MSRKTLESPQLDTRRYKPRPKLWPLFRNAWAHRIARRELPKIHEQ
jgi:hypothetical protein